VIAAQATGRTIVTICARGGSKGLAGNNIRSFAGRPLIAATIANALAYPDIDGVYVSIDDQTIAAVAREAGATVPALCPVDLATDAAAKRPVIEHLVQYVERNGLTVAHIVDLQSTSPLRFRSDVTAELRVRPRVCRWS